MIPYKYVAELPNFNDLVVVVHRSLAAAQREAANRIALEGEVRHTALGVAGVHRTGRTDLEVKVHRNALEAGEAHHIVLLMEVAVGRQEADHREYEPHSLLVAVETGIVLLVGIAVAHREAGLLRMATAGVAVAVGVGSHIAD